MDNPYVIGARPEKGPLALPADVLLRHAVSIGASGSGKTVAMKAICEEAIRHGVPVIALDPQGDLASLGILADRAKAIEKGCPADVYDGYAQRYEVVVWTPASTDGVPIAVNPLKTRFEGADPETVTKALTAQAEAICTLLELSSKTAVAFLHLVLEYLHRERIELRDFAELAKFLDAMPRRLQEEVQDLATPALIDGIGQQLKVATVGARGLLFRLGAPIDIDVLLGRHQGTPGKTRLSVIYLNTLGSQDEKDFFVQMLVSALYQWMLRRPSERLQALFYIDEVGPYLPPVRKPACKDALQLLFKQARKYGIGCLAATQNPGDLDYKALAQVSTWNLGRILVKQDLKKVEKFFQALSPLNAPRIMKRLPALATGEFELLSPDAFQEVQSYKVRWLASEHRTLEPGELDRVNDAALARRLAGDAEEVKTASPAREAPSSKPAARVAGQREIEEADTEPISARTIAAAAALDAEDAEDDAAAAEPRDQALVRVRAILQGEPRIFTRKELVEAAQLTPARVDRALERLAVERLIRRYDQARAHAFAWHGHRLRPDLGLYGPVERFTTQVFEGTAREWAESSLATSFFVKQEKVAAVKFFYFPLVKLHFKATKETGWIFKERRESTENLYLHPQTCDIVHCEAGKIEFHPTTEDHPLDHVDLDHVGRLEPAQPGDLELRREDFDESLGLDEVAQRAARKFPLQIISVGWAFLPCWSFAIERKEGAGKRTLVVDAVVGREIKL